MTFAQDPMFETVTLEEALALPADLLLDALIGVHVMGLPLETDPFPAYSTDIAAAWEVVEKLWTDAGDVSVSAEAGSWDCTITGDNFVVLCCCYAETAPLAICRAALRFSWKNPNS